MASRSQHPDRERSSGASRKAILAAFGVSGLLHGALAATLLGWDRGPTPLPAGPVIEVELVSLAPQRGTDTGAAGPATVQEEPGTTEATGTPDAAPAPEPEAAASPVAATEPAASPVSDAEPEAIADPPPPPEEEAVVETRLNSPPTQVVSAPPPALASVRPPLRPRQFPPAVTIAPDPVTTTFEGPVAEVMAREREPGPERPAASSAEPTDGQPVGNEVPLEIAGIPDGGRGRDAASGGSGGDPGGVFSGPSFRLGSAENPLPRYPAVARRRGWEGRVVLRVEVGTDGRPISVAVATSSAHPVLDDAASHAIRQWRFEPGRRAGQPVVASVEVPIQFRLRD